jgi:hypothetical protein
MCRTRPSSDSVDGGTDRSASCSGVSPPHFSSNVARWYSRRSSSAARSSIGLFGGSSRSGVVQVDIPATLRRRALLVLLVGQVEFW